MGQASCVRADASDPAELLLAPPAYRTSCLPSRRRSRFDSLVALEEAKARRGVFAINSRYHTQKALSEAYTIEEKVLGSGCSGPVRLARRDGKSFAVKSYKKKLLNRVKRAELKCEVEIYLSLDHEGIARLEDVFETEMDIHLVMELCEGGELHGRLSEQRQYTEDAAAAATRQMLLSVYYLHSNKIVHRDLKLENFLYESKDSDVLKLIDFGFAKYIDPSRKMTQSCGSLHYVAPEVLRCEYDEKCDMWSLGVITFMLLTGSPPFFGTDVDVVDKIQNGRVHFGRRWQPLSATSKDFVQRLLTMNTTERMTAEEALAHPWITAAGQGVEVPVAPAVLRNLRKFAHASHFRRACLSLMAWSLPSEDRVYLRKQFDALDLNHDGTITMKELQTVLADSFHIGVDEAEELFRSIDTNGDLKICYSEFMAAAVRHRVRMHEDIVRQAFHRFDVDECGFVTLDNLRTILGDTFDGESVGKLLEEAGTSCDGRISYEEFLEYLQDPEADEEDEGSAEGLTIPGLGTRSLDDPDDDALDVDTQRLLPPGGTHGSPSGRRRRHAEFAVAFVDKAIEDMTPKGGQIAVDAENFSRFFPPMKAKTGRARGGEPAAEFD